MEDLPEIIPLFPLPNVVLFPHVDLPLHVFEPRYREMVRDALDGDRLIGMALLRGEWRKDYHASPPIYQLGCVGCIENVSSLPDGRFNLVLHGLRRFEIIEEIAGKPYRRARVQWRPDQVAIRGLTPAIELRLRSSVTRLVERAHGEVAGDLWQRLPNEAEKLVNTLAFALDLSEIEKLALLECGDLGTRSERLVEVIEFRLAERVFGGSDPGGGERRH